MSKDMESTADQGEGSRIVAQIGGLSRDVEADMKDRPEFAVETAQKILDLFSSLEGEFAEDPEVEQVIVLCRCVIKQREIRASAIKLSRAGSRDASGQKKVAETVQQTLQALPAVEDAMITAMDPSFPDVVIHVLRPLQEIQTSLKKILGS